MMSLSFFVFIYLFSILGVVVAACSCALKERDKKDRLVYFQQFGSLFLLDCRIMGSTFFFSVLLFLLSFFLLLVLFCSYFVSRPGLRSSGPPLHTFVVATPFLFLFLSPIRAPLLTTTAVLRLYSPNRYSAQPTLSTTVFSVYIPPSPTIINSSPSTQRLLSP